MENEKDSTEEEVKNVELDSHSKDLIEKWQQQAKALKKKNPKWSQDRILLEMKKKIDRQAKAVVSKKSGKSHLQEMKKYVKKLEDNRNTIISGIMNYMAQKSPEAIGTVLFDLNCGCMRACAVSEDGGPLGEMIMVFGQPVKDGYECSLCKEDGGADPERCVNKSIIWPGEESEMPSEDFRLSIGQKVFGDDYSLDDI